MTLLKVTAAGEIDAAFICAIMMEKPKIYILPHKAVTLKSIIFEVLE